MVAATIAALLTLRSISWRASLPTTVRTDGQPRSTADSFEARRIMQQRQRQQQQQQQPQQQQQQQQHPDFIVSFCFFFLLQVLLF